MMVLIKNSWKVAPDSKRVYHTEQCQYVERCKDSNMHERQLDNLPDDVRECKECKGTLERPSKTGSLHHHLENCNPDDLGLTPMGER